MGDAYVFERHELPNDFIALDASEEDVLVGPYYKPQIEFLGESMPVLRWEDLGKQP